MLLDTSAWIEFFLGTEKGKKAEGILNSEPSFTALVSVAEIVVWCLRNQQNVSGMLQKVATLTRILPVTVAIAVNAAQVTVERKKTVKRWGLLDGFIYTTALMYGLTVLTTDHYFAGLPSVEML